ncbi:MAG: DegT/DnrJ/EryC1/StrS family aminotransferase [Proteobacteria bacterium]|nr:DegT/DnrJ/EryC1/StrS family aminotransferase [Pseudomonadota bacterium]
MGVLPERLLFPENVLPFKINQVDLGVDADELKLISSCIERRWLSEGPLAQQFVEELRHTLGAKAITPNTRALLPVHLYGQACDMPGLLRLAEKHGLKILEDAAQAYGVTFAGKQAGTFGDAGIISFFSDKVITTGEGGAVLTNSEALYDRLRLLRNQGRPHSGTFVHPSLGMNFRMTDLQAGVGLVQMKKFSKIHDERLRKWKLYEDGLKGVGDLQPMRVHEKSNLVPFRYPVLSKKREGALAAMEKAGIQTRGFFYPMHLQPMLRSDPPQSLPVSEKLFAEGFCLPVHPHLSDADIATIIDVLRDYYKSGA